MDTRDLRYFVAAAELGQLHRAAERVGRSQPALTKCIHRLESELGAKLFEREGRAIRLTAAGGALLASARGILRSIQDAVCEVSELSTGATGHVRIGCGSTMADWLLPTLFARLLEQSPGLNFQIATGVATVLRQSLREGKLDLVIGPLLGRDTEEFTSFAIADDTMVVAARAGHRLAGRQVSMPDLADCGWLLPGPFVISTHWLQLAFETQGLDVPHLQIETDTVLLLRRVIAQTELLTFISRRDLRPSSGVPLAEIDVPELRLRRDLGVLWRPGRYLSAVAQRLIGLLREEGKTMLAA